MNFPQFWARGGNGNFLVWRWSFRSLAEAQSLADDAAHQLAARIHAKDFPLRHTTYYPDRPFREQVLREFRNGSGEATSVITRNSYGCLVLNTARVMFVDIDLPEPEPSGFFERLLGKPKITPNTDLQNALERIENWTRKHSEWGWRIYRTRSGLRLLATQDLMDPNSDAASSVFEALGADPLYQKLCFTQKCFRARLTPKPWRCGIHSKPERWPWLDAKREMRFQKWETQYLSRAETWATCEFVRHIGNSTVHPEVQTVLKIHDPATRAESKLPLA